ncbi:glycine oxidase ThiO [Pseudomonas cavernae]|uniref:Glycine oxidase ThiO n=1 Tax=Pseudomonas cavernae TaxID=2320867 RepID=A0A385Z2I9_9PSED|nr:glycine oxidase ThiO [Pseudomonas cavernae]AYC32347.1 glycine oxidase ThiO [Pseudomonas cavernae]
MAKTLIVGGGVIGLLSAQLLAAQGEEVLLVERQQLGAESSWAGGGIVSLLYPWRYSPAVCALAHWSQAFYPAWGERLRDSTGIDPEVRATGLFWLDLEDEQQALDWAREQGRKLTPVNIEKVAQNVPALGEGFRRALHMPGVANVRNPRLLRALRATLAESANVTVLENTEVSGFLLQAGCVLGVNTSHGELRAERAERAERVVLASGAWSGELLTTLGLELPVEPIKGQMILYKCAEDYLSTMILARGRYAIPRKDGHILVGSTLEHAGFDKAPTNTALASLKASVQELLPALAGAEVVGHWAGLRPGSPEGIPFIGEVAEFPGLWLNCGHYRNGLLLAPASCQLLTDLMLGHTPIVEPTPYAPAGRLG